MTSEITISKAEYDRKTEKALFLNLLCEELVVEWVDGERNGYGGISNTVKRMLEAFDPDRTDEVKRMAKNARKERMNEKPATPGEIKPGKGNSIPAFIEMPYAPPVAPNDVPYINITCEAQGGTEE